MRHSESTAEELQGARRGPNRDGGEDAEHRCSSSPPHPQPCSPLATPKDVASLRDWSRWGGAEETHMPHLPLGQERREGSQVSTEALARPRASGRVPAFTAIPFQGPWLSKVPIAPFGDGDAGCEGPQMLNPCEIE